MGRHTRKISGINVDFRHHAITEHRGIFLGVRSPTPGARYHSLVVAARGLPEALEVSARDDDGVIMGLRHRRRPVESVQFHPESYLTPEGPRMLANFLAQGRR